MIEMTASEVKIKQDTADSLWFTCINVDEPCTMTTKYSYNLKKLFDLLYGFDVSIFYS